MGKKWDYDVPTTEVWQECLRVLKPGGHLLSFFGTRTYHRGVVRVEDAGFEVRDQIGWAYGSGFPKSLDVGKAIDKAAGAKREIIGTDRNYGASKAEDGKQAYGDYEGSWDITTPSTDAAKQWNGWGTALKPAWEPIVVARKPLIGTVAENVLAHGTGAINVDGCRVGTGEKMSHGGKQRTEMGYHGGTDADGSFGTTQHPQGRWPANLCHDGSGEVVGCFPSVATKRIEKPSDCDVSGETSFESMRGNRPARGYTDEGSAARFFKSCPFNEDDVCLQEKLDQIANGAVSPCDSCGTPTAPVPAETSSLGSISGESPATAASTGSCGSSTQPQELASAAGEPGSTATTPTTQSHSRLCGCARHATDESTSSERKERAADAFDLGTATRFLYCAKASKRDRDEGLELAEDRTLNRVNPGGLENDPKWGPVTRKNHHPTVKPTDLMRWLVRLVTPPGGTVLDPFCGSGSTGKAAKLEGFSFIGIEREAEYAKIAEARINAVPDTLL